MIHLTKTKNLSSILTSEESEKVTTSLVEHVYSQLLVSFFSSLVCATLLFIGLYQFSPDNQMLFVWANIYILIALLRLILYPLYKLNKHAIRSNHWVDFYFLSCILGGMTWGFAGLILFPNVDHLHQMLIVLMIAGVTAGSVPLSAPIPKAGVSFLITAILPLIISMALYRSSTYNLFTITVLFYLIYTIILTFKIYHLIRDTIVLKYENDILLKDLEKSNQSLQQTAMHDPLTNVANRRLFETNLENALQHAHRYKHSVALFYIDLDNFKPANDTYGHEAGDVILKTITDRLSTYFRKEDMVSRLGGDEFAVIIENMQHKDHLNIIGKKILELIAIPIPYDNLDLLVTASIGIAIYPNNAIDSKSLTAHADQCMYYAKTHGGNQFYMQETEKA